MQARMPASSIAGARQRENGWNRMLFRNRSKFDLGGAGETEMRL